MSEMKLYMLLLCDVNADNTKLIEETRSLFPSKKFNESSFLLYANIDSQEIHKKVATKEDGGFIIMEFDAWYGNFTDDVKNWIKKMEPNYPFLSDEDLN